MKLTIVLLLSLFVFAGCRREDWREYSFELPPQVEFNALQRELKALDRETPPFVRLEQGTVFVCYNSMHLAPRNLTYVRDTLVKQTEE